MKRKNSFRLLRRLFKTVGADKVIYGYLLFFVLVAFILRVVDPGIDNIFRGMWYCFTAASTIGFGDVVVQTLVGRILTVILSIYSVAVIGIFTAVVTSFYMEFVRCLHISLQYEQSHYELSNAFFQFITPFYK